MLFSKRQRSSVIAKDRLKLLLVSERVGCTPDSMLMLKNDLLQAVGKYFCIEEVGIEIKYARDTCSLSAKFPIISTTNKKY